MDLVLKYDTFYYMLYHFYASSITLRPLQAVTDITQFECEVYLNCAHINLYFSFFTLQNQHLNQIIWTLVLECENLYKVLSFY